jgi:hypothetical protein
VDIKQLGNLQYPTRQQMRDLIALQADRINELEGYLHHEKRQHKITSLELKRVHDLRVNYRDRLKELRLDITALESKLKAAEDEKHLEPICKRCRAYDAGFCLNLHESIETDVIICEHFAGWDTNG